MQLDWYDQSIRYQSLVGCLEDMGSMKKERPVLLPPSRCGARMRGQFDRLELSSADGYLK